ncbi:MAG: hypothetical protein ABI988_08825 [Nitrospirota bacterium]
MWTLLVLLLFPLSVHAEYLGNLSADEYDPNSIANQYGASNPYSSDSITNQFGIYGNPYSNQSATNPYATDAPRIYDKEGHYRGKLSTNQYDPDSVSNPYGGYGNPYSPDSLNNPYGAKSISLRQSDQPVWLRLAHRRAIALHYGLGVGDVIERPNSFGRRDTHSSESARPKMFHALKR